MARLLNSSTWLIAPAQPVGNETEAKVAFATRMDLYGERVGIAFTTIKRLAQAMGESQPWVCIPLEQLKKLHFENGVHRLMIDPKFRGEMSKGYHVILDDLEEAYKAFFKEEHELCRQKHKVNCPVPDCGSSDTTKACKDALDVVTTLYAILVKTVESHGQKMKKAHDGYSRDNADVLNLFHSLEG